MKAEKSRFSWIGVILLVGGLLVLTASFTASVTRAHAATTAFVRIIHASPFVGSADVFLDGSPLLTSFGFGAITDYAAVPEGSHKVQIALAGKGIGTAALTQTLAVQPGGVYTVAATGTDAQSLGLIVFNDDNVASAGTSKVRVYQLSPDAGTMNFIAGGQTLWDGGYKEASEYFTLSAGSASISFDSSKYNKPLALTADLKPNTVTSIFAVGMFSGSPGAQLVQKQVDAVPGMPSTGSDPMSVIPEINGSAPWLLISLVAVFVGGALLTRRWLHAH